MTVGELREQWQLIRGQWDQLEIEQALIQHWPLEKRWMLDDLLQDMRSLDILFDPRELRRRRRKIAASGCWEAFRPHRTRA
jgi:hypothetical protein